MKVGTDGTLLGSWAPVNSVRKVLDIGTGTGLIALMIAQRQPLCHVDAIDIDADTDEIIDEALNRFENVFKQVVKTAKCSK